MAADSKLDLPGNFQPGKKYLIKGDTLIAWRTALLADRAIPGPGMKEQQTPQGRVFTGGGGSPVKFYVWKEGEMGTMDIQASAFKELPPP